MKINRKLVLLRARLEKLTYKQMLLLMIGLSVITGLIVGGFILLTDMFIDLQLEKYEEFNYDFFVSIQNTITIIATVSVLFPIIETFIFQHLIFHFLKVVIGDGIPVKYIIISSLLFGLAHGLVWTTGTFLGILTFIDKILGGIIYAVSYYIFYRN